MPMFSRVSLRVLLFAAGALATPAFADEAQRTQIPDPGETGLSHPAPAFRILPAGPASETHQH
ncbi:hypothetical protein JKL49_02860 [Phenylobacterium sp. 20VBR1]|uniref:Uncharacterized protein n=1 Tax=Phenylobacterium glaciei TaxID=2803784 RepID=A0A941HV49_9CAUL|nr:hypothetical protein [Phenylobacterium glaciei]MBR7618318.1 hypothetical protein [Phenylobacterium glaciei]